MGQRAERIKEQLAEIDGDMMLADGFDDALLGYVEVAGGTLVALYDREKCIDLMMKRNKVDRERAIESFDFNVAGAYVGQGSPAFATFIK